MASLTKRNGKWQFRVSYKDLDGKFRTKTKGGFATKKQASLASAKMESILLSGNLNNQNLLFKDYMQSWFEVFRKGKKSKANDDDIRRACDFVDRYFPNTKLSQLKRIDYQKALNKYGENHATASVLKHHLHEDLYPRSHATRYCCY